WCVLALALNSLPESPYVWVARSWAARVLPVPLTAAVGLYYLLAVFQPVTNCAGELNEARSHYNGFLKRQREATDELKAVRSAEARSRVLSSLNGYLDGAILKPLLRASEGDAGNAVPHTELAHWYGEQWKLFPGEPRVGEKAVAHAMLA